MLTEVTDPAATRKGLPQGGLTSLACPTHLRIESSNWGDNIVRAMAALPRLRELCLQDGNHHGAITRAGLFCWAKY